MRCILSKSTILSKRLLLFTCTQKDECLFRGDARRKKVRAGAGDGDSMVEWAAYVAMHVEDGARRERLVRSTLHGRCADWCDDEGKTSFLRDVLGVPTPWLEEARREWFDYNWWETD